MSLDVCFVYQWATYGGVERVFLNRARAFEANGEDVRVDVYYCADGGGLNSFVDTIRRAGLERTIRVVGVFDAARYDVVFVIDTPDMLPNHLSGNTRWVVECHTPYLSGRTYLDSLPQHVKEVVVPSHTFAKALVAERPMLVNRVRLLRNCVSPHMEGPLPKLPSWRKRSLLYFGRLDELKNPQGFLDLLSELELRRPGTHLGVIVGPEVPGYDLDGRIERTGLRGRVLRIPPLHFIKTSQFLMAWRYQGGVMVSPSRGESFGLAAAEAIAAGIPVLLSAIPEHSELLGGDAGHLYDPDDPVAGADRIEEMFTCYDESSARMERCSSKFDDMAFIEDWTALIQDFGVR